MEKISNKNLLVFNFAICLVFNGCTGSARSYSIISVDRNAVFSPEKKTNPLMLVVEITEDGKLSLNRIETGTIDNVTLLSEKLRVIFEDREKASITEREVLIDPRGKVKNEDLENLIEALAGAKASPIRVIKDN